MGNGHHHYDRFSLAITDLRYNLCRALTICRHANNSPRTVRTLFTCTSGAAAAAAATAGT